MTSMTSFAHVSDEGLLAEVKALAGHERRATVGLIASLGELDSRRLFLGEGCSSLFTYCTQVLHLSEHAAYGRIEAARAARRFPLILELFADGSINLTTIGLLASHLTSENHAAVLASAKHRPKREVERLVAELSPRAAVASSIRKLPMPVRSAGLPPAAPDSSPHPGVVSSRPAVAPEAQPVIAAPPPRRAAVAPLTPERYKMQLIISRETHGKLRRVQDLMRHANPDGDPAVIFERALTVLLEVLEKRKLAATHRPRHALAPKAGSRHIPSAVKREVWGRDGGQCAFQGENGRCRETGFLEYHHVVPHAEGGGAVATNIALRCRSHNAYESDRHFGRWRRAPLTESGILAGSTGSVQTE